MNAETILRAPRKIEISTLLRAPREIPVNQEAPSQTHVLAGAGLVDGRGKIDFSRCP